jgi:ParB-like chromosome segregation protein Spo0J
MGGGLLKIEQRPVATLIPYIRNSRTHSEAQIAQIIASIQEFGWTNPILIDGENGILAGHGRLKAAQQLGMSEVPVVELAGLSDVQKRAYIIADNKLAENAGWDRTLLHNELHELQAAEFDVSIIGFDWNDLKAHETNAITDETKYYLMIEYENEQQLEQAFHEAQERGLKCKIIE